MEGCIVSGQGWRFQAIPGPGVCAKSCVSRSELQAVAAQKANDFLSPSGIHLQNQQGAAWAKIGDDPVSVPIPHETCLFSIGTGPFSVSSLQMSMGRTAASNIQVKENRVLGSQPRSSRVLRLRWR
jgi:hypothetical protein